MNALPLAVERVVHPLAGGADRVSQYEAHQRRYILTDIAKMLVSPLSAFGAKRAKKHIN